MTGCGDQAVTPQLVVHCPSCDAKIDITEGVPFQRRTCPTCGGVFDAPGAFSVWHLKGKLANGRHTLVADAIDPVLERPLALKIYYTLNDLAESDRMYFFRQIIESARKMMAVPHGCIVSVHDCRMVETCPVLALERLSGANAATASPGVTLLPALAGIASALAAAESAGIVHYEVYPENFLVADETTWKLTNFRVGKPFHDIVPGGEEPYAHFLAPETLIMGEVGVQADLFSFGVSLYDRLTGRSPYRDGGVWTNYLEYAASGRFVPITDRNPDVPSDVAELVAKLLSPHPKDRGTFADAAAILTAYRAN